MNGMDMGIAPQLGPFASFVAMWVTMMAAMMLPKPPSTRRWRWRSSGLEC
jgi:predicted metal-binding membrane protein